MQTSSGWSRATCRATTLLEVLVILAVIVVLAGIVIPGLARARQRSARITCTGQLKNLALAQRIFATDNGGQYSHQRSNRFGGALEWSAEPQQLWRHFAALSNEIVTPVILHCPSDEERVPVATWVEATNNRILSYFVGVQAREEQPQSILMGDRNLTLDGLPLENRRVTLPTTATVAFDMRMHRFAGNVALGDGSVQQTTSGRLQQQATAAGPGAPPAAWIFP